MLNADNLQINAPTNYNSVVFLFVLVAAAPVDVIFLLAVFVTAALEFFIIILELLMRTVTIIN